MCGIVVAVGRNARDLVEVGMKAQAHRGLRSQVEEGFGWALGHVRLPIVGLEEDHDQPVRRGRWSVAFVGEVLDFRERRPGAECDIDLVADTWADEGPAGFCSFDGFWAVAAVDRGSGEVHLMTDYLCQKPLYVRRCEGVLAAASEPDALAAMGGPPELDEVYLAAVLRWGYCPDVRRTPYRGVCRVLPGEHAVLDPEVGDGPAGPMEALRFARRDPLSAVQGSLEDLCRELEAAVRRRVESADVPVACLVSGGLDSSAVLALARRWGDIRTYHAENGEWDRCHLVAPEAVRVSMDDVPLAEALASHQEPVDLGSLVPQVALARAISARGGERVCLTGDGADELFGGYGRARRYDSQASDVWQELVAWHLPRLDRTMMRHQIEVRSPFLARRVAGLALGLPWAERTRKQALREALNGLLPDIIMEAPKVPLRTAEVSSDREGRSIELVKLFRETRRGLCR